MKSFPQGPAPVPAAPSVEQIADAFDLLAKANRWLRRELDEIAVCRTPLSQTCVDRLTALGQRMQPAAAARTRLQDVDPAMLLAGVALWEKRQHGWEPDPEPVGPSTRQWWATGGAR
jgi:hypothetical protein